VTIAAKRADLHRSVTIPAIVAKHLAERNS
jgi:hypothetical protein